MLLLETTLHDRNLSPSLFSKIYQNLDKLYSSSSYQTFIILLIRPHDQQLYINFMHARAIYYVYTVGLTSIEGRSSIRVQGQDVRIIQCWLGPFTHKNQNQLISENIKKTVSTL